jgi:hypothetical protein
MGFKKGEPRPENAGRKVGSLNNLTKTVKERVLETFNELQQDEQTSLTGWAKTELTEFYKIAAKLIPQDVNNTIKIGKELEDEQYKE